MGLGVKVDVGKPAGTNLKPSTQQMIQPGYDSSCTGEQQQQDSGQILEERWM